MFNWCMFLFGLGILAFLDTIFNYGEIFRRINSVLFLLLTLGLLIRTRMLSNSKPKETLEKRNADLEKQLAELMSQTTRKKELQDVEQ